MLTSTELILENLKKTPMSHRELVQVTGLTGADISHVLHKLAMKEQAKLVDGIWVFTPETDGGRTIQLLFEEGIRNGTRVRQSRPKSNR